MRFVNRIGGGGEGLGGNLIYIYIYIYIYILRVFFEGGNQILSCELLCGFQRKFRLFIGILNMG